MELIKITTNEQNEQLVSARDLHRFLEIKKDFSDWIKTYINNNDYGFENGLDYTTFKGNSTESTPRPRIEYILKLDMAKELCMLSKVEKGRQARRYFIECEKKLKMQQPEITEEQKLVLAIYSGGIEAVEATKSLIELKTKPLIKEIEYKEDVIVGLTDKIDLMDMRQILNTVVRYKGANFRDRWKLLYFEFEKKYHMDLKRRILNYNKANKTKINKLDYIEKNLNKLPELYKIACKLFEGDINKIIENYKKVC